MPLEKMIVLSVFRINKLWRYKRDINFLFHIFFSILFVILFFL